MRDRPILFSGPMIRAILAGQKTVTRRVVTSRFPDSRGAAPNVEAGVPFAFNATGYEDNIRCPYGWPGDRLWVRETFAVNPKCPTVQVAYRADGKCYGVGGDGGGGFARIFHGYLHDAPGRGDALGDTFGRATYGRWRPSIFMPRWASRITLEVIGVRVERLQEITNADGLCEGVMVWAAEQQTPVRDLTCSDARLGFLQAWDTINGKRPGCAWADNPWVWRVEFRRVEPAS